MKVKSITLVLFSNFEIKGFITLLEKLAIYNGKESKITHSIKIHNKMLTVDLSSEDIHIITEFIKRDVYVKFQFELNKLLIYNTNTIVK